MKTIMKMKFFFFVSAFVFLAALPARAQDGEIKIINEDGSVTEFKIPKNEDAMRRTPQPEYEAPVSAPAPSARKEKPAKREEKENPLVQRDFLGRVLSHEEKKAEPAPAKPAKEDIAGEKTQRTLPYPARKPAVPPGYEEDQSSAPGTPISQNAAVAIAIKNAPPASDYKVFRAMHNGARVYAVVFKTDYGDREILIDALTGDIVKK